MLTRDCFAATLVSVYLEISAIICVFGLLCIVKAKKNCWVWVGSGDRFFTCIANLETLQHEFTAWIAMGMLTYYFEKSIEGDNLISFRQENSKSILESDAIDSSFFLIQILAQRSVRKDTRRWSLFQAKYMPLDSQAGCVARFLLRYTKHVVRMSVASGCKWEEIGATICGCWDERYC